MRYIQESALVPPSARQYRETAFSTTVWVYEIARKQKEMDHRPVGGGSEKHFQDVSGRQGQRNHRTTLAGAEGACPHGVLAEQLTAEGRKGLAAEPVQVVQDHCAEDFVPAGMLRRYYRLQDLLQVLQEQSEAGERPGKLGGIKRRP